ncbi:MAG: radical SAM protein [Spirochaetales bacterium]|nr:radical SAM protein [Spirochaetales bacterium]
MTLGELSWIDGLIKRIKKYIFVRSFDRVLILPPNKVYKLNLTGTALLEALLKGKSITRFRFLKDKTKAEQVHNFFCDLKAFFQGCPELPEQRRAVESTAYGFDYTILPILGEIAVTYRCNNNCSFCYVGNKQTREKQDAELRLSEIKKIIRIFKYKAQIPFFSFTGGEPLLRADLEKMVRYAIHLGLRVNLITNGTLISEKRAQSLRKSGLGTAQVSVESPESSIHDALTGRAGSFSRTLKGIHNLQQAGISVQTNTTVNQQNVSSLKHLPQFLKQIGITRFSMNLYIPSGKDLAHEELFFAYSAVADIIEHTRKQAKKLGLTFYWYSPLPHCYYNPIARGLGNKSCAAMDGLLSVSPQGEVLPCSSYHESMGNLLDEDFKDIWFSKRARFFKHKQFAPSECSGCDQFTACQSACPLYWDYAGTRELKNKHSCGVL